MVAVMTVLESFLSFAEHLPADRRQSVEAILTALMATYSEHHGFSTDELDMLDRRTADPDPRFADPDVIDRLFGKPFSE